MRKFIVALLIVAALGLAAAGVGCGNRLNLGTSTTYNPNTTSTFISGGD